jgi:hypothetical protein
LGPRSYSHLGLDHEHGGLHKISYKSSYPVSKTKDPGTRRVRMISITRPKAEVRIEITMEILIGEVKLLERDWRRMGLRKFLEVWEPETRGAQVLVTLVKGEENKREGEEEDEFLGMADGRDRVGEQGGLFGQQLLEFRRAEGGDPSGASGDPSGAPSGSEKDPKSIPDNSPTNSPPKSVGGTGPEIDRQSAPDEGPGGEDPNI